MADEVMLSISEQIGVIAVMKLPLIHNLKIFMQ